MAIENIFQQTMLGFFFVFYKSIVKILFGQVKIDPGK